MYRFIDRATAKYEQLDVTTLISSIVQGLPSRITVKDLALHFANSAQSNGMTLLAGNLEMFALHKDTPNSFTKAMRLLPLEPDFLKKIEGLKLDRFVQHDMDFTYDLFALRTLKRSYLMREGGKKDSRIVERPQYMLMRVAASLYDTESEILTAYSALSAKEFTFATPTLFNAGCKNGQYASCFLGVMQDDSIEGIFNTIKQTAQISKMAGGIGISLSNIRATGSPIMGTMGVSNGIVPMLRVFNETARYVDQGGGRRKGSFAMYMEPWHPDVEAFLDLRKNHGDENQRTRDLFTALWVPDLFMQRVKDDGNWSLFCPTQVPLQEVHSAAFEKMYKEAEARGVARKTMKARVLWNLVIRSQIETGTPYIMFKDQVNRCSNQQHLGTIKGSNLCAEICEYTSPDEIAVCTLASIALPRFVHGDFDFTLLGRRVEEIVQHLDRVVDVTYYPLDEAKHSNTSHRPLGIGVQGLSDTFQKLGLAYDSEAAVAFDAQIFECIYYHALKASCDLAKERGAHASFEGSPASEGKLQFDFYDVVPTNYDWDSLKQEIRLYGLRNSLLIALMPTASTAQILGNSEGTDPRTSNLYTRRVLSGEFIVENHILRESCGDRWEEVRKIMMRDYGSVQKTTLENKFLFKTVWEISQKYVIDHAAARQPFVCQSQSMNLHLAEPTPNKVNSMLFYAWKKKLKTGMYYLRSRPKANPNQICRRDTQGCESCSA